MKHPLKNVFFIILFIAIVTSCGLFSPAPESYSVSFTVSGLLDGNSVTMDLNGEEELTATADGDFFFPTKVEQGAEYRVTVKEQPTGQTATVSNGVGVMPAAPVTNVAVAVTTNTYSVGGTVSGIPTGESITISLNGTSDLIIGSNGSFAFTNEVPYGSSYAVTETSVPAGYMLTIDNAGGTMGAGNVSNIVVTCTERTFTVGGTLEGLTGPDEISLTLNGGDPIVMAADGSFTFTDRLNDGDIYTVAVSGYTGGGTYVLTNSTGRIEGADIQDVSVFIAITLTDIADPTTLTPGGVYLVADNDDVYVTNDLTIYEGTTIIFGSNASMIVSSGSLNATGTAAEPIIFTGEDEVAGYWKGVVFHNSNSTDNSLDHVIIEYAGSNSLYYANELANLAVTQLNSNPCRVEISNTILRNGAGYGFYADPGVTIASFTANTCTENTQGAAHMPAALVSALGSDSDYSGNIGGNDFVYIDAGDSQDVGADMTWNDLGVPYRIGPMNNRLDIAAALTIEAGSEFEVELGTEIQVKINGTLIAVGTDTAPIRFAGSTPQEGHWKGINFLQSNASANRLSYVTVEHAGSSTMDYADVEAGVAITTNGAPCRCLIDYCTLQNNQGYGLFVDSGDADFSGFVNNTITGNTVGAVSLYADKVAELDATSSYSGNGTDQIYVNTGEPINTLATWHNLGTGVNYLFGGINTTLNVSAALTIEAGTTLTFMQGTVLRVGSSGSLNAVGESGNEILFTGATAETGHWEGINFLQSYASANHLSYVTVEYAGSTTMDYADVEAGVAVVTNGADCRCLIDNCTLKDNIGYGLFADSAAEIAGFANNTITGNTVGAVSLYANNVAQLDATSSYTGNGVDQVYVNVSPAVAAAQTWRNLGTGVTYLLGPDGNNVTVNAGLTLEAGTHFKFMQRCGVLVNSGGFLTAEGTSGNEIIFTGSTEQPDWWRGINYFRTNSTSNILSYAVVEYGGYEAWTYADTPANVTIVTYGQTSQASISDCEISDTNGAGIWIDAEATVNPDIAAAGVNTFANCGGGNIVDTRP